MADHADFAHLITDVIGCFGLWPLGEPEPVLSGTLNWNYRIQTDGGDVFVRRYRDQQLETSRILGEHRLVKWAEERGVPIPLPYETPDDHSLVSIGGGRWSVYPWIEGELVERGKLSAAQVRTLGALHGYTQEVLLHHPESDGAVMQMRWSKEESAGYLRQILKAADGRPADVELRDAVAKQLARLDAMDVLPPEAFAALPVQMLHGDFHDHQVLWQGGSISALVDWEIWHADPRVWELVRSLAFSQLLDSPLIDEYLAGYREFVQLSEAECRLGLKLWWQSRVVGVWAWAAYFLQGNERVSRFFPAMIAESELISDEGWRGRIEQRFVLGALG